MAATTLYDYFLTPNNEQNRGSLDSNNDPSAVFYPDYNQVNVMGPLYVPRVYGKDLSALEIASSGIIAISLRDVHSFDFDRNIATSNITLKTLAQDSFAIGVNTDRMGLQFAAAGDANDVKLYSDSNVLISACNILTLASKSFSQSLSEDYSLAAANITMSAVSNIQGTACNVEFYGSNEACIKSLDAEVCATPGAIGMTATTSITTDAPTQSNTATNFSLDTAEYMYLHSDSNARLCAASNLYVNTCEPGGSLWIESTTMNLAAPTMNLAASNLDATASNITMTAADTMSLTATNFVYNFDTISYLGTNIASAGETVSLAAPGASIGITESNIAIASGDIVSIGASNLTASASNIELFGAEHLCLKSINAEVCVEPNEVHITGSNLVNVTGAELSVTAQRDEFSLTVGFADQDAGAFFTIADTLYAEYTFQPGPLQIFDPLTSTWLAMEITSVEVVVWDTSKRQVNLTNTTSFVFAWNTTYLMRAPGMRVASLSVSTITHNIVAATSNCSMVVSNSNVEIRASERVAVRATNFYLEDTATPNTYFEMGEGDVNLTSESSVYITVANGAFHQKSINAEVRVGSAQQFTETITAEGHQDIETFGIITVSASNNVMNVRQTPVYESIWVNVNQDNATNVASPSITFNNPVPTALTVGSSFSFDNDQDVKSVVSITLVDGKDVVGVSSPYAAPPVNPEMLLAYAGSAQIRIYSVLPSPTTALQLLGAEAKIYGVASNISFVATHNVDVASGHMTMSASTGSITQRAADTFSAAASNAVSIVSAGHDATFMAASNVYFKAQSEAMYIQMTEDAVSGSNVIAGDADIYKWKVAGTDMITVDHNGLRIDGNIKVLGSLDTINVTETNLQVMDKKVVLSYSEAPITDGLITNDQSGITVQGSDYEKSLLWRYNQGTEHLGSSDLDKESYWEMKGGSFRMTHSNVALGGEMSFGFRINNMGELEIVKKMPNSETYKRVAKFGRTLM